MLKYKDFLLSNSQIICQRFNIYEHDTFHAVELSMKSFIALGPGHNWCYVKAISYEYIAIVCKIRCSDIFSEKGLNVI